MGLNIDFNSTGNNDDLERKLSIQDEEFRTFGFITSQMRRGFIVGAFVLCVLAIIYLFFDNRRLNQKLDDKSNDEVRLEERLYERMLIYVQPKLKSIDSTTVQIDSTIKINKNLQSKLLKRISHSK